MCKIRFCTVFVLCNKIHVVQSWLMNKNLLAILVILVAGTILFLSGEFPDIKKITLDQSSSSHLPTLLPPDDDSLIKFNLPVIAIHGTESALSAEAWTIFQNYLNFAKNHDLASIRSLSHQISPTCNDTSKEKDCFALMDSVYSFANSYKLSDFNHIQSDGRQIVMYTDGPTVAILYFTRNADDIKVLGMRFCFEDEATVGTCVKTDSIKHDLNGNGWWDSVELLFY